MIAYGVCVTMKVSDHQYGQCQIYLKSMASNANSSYIFFIEGVHTWNNYDCLWCLDYNKGMTLESKVKVKIYLKSV